MNPNSRDYDDYVYGCFESIELIGRVYYPSVEPLRRGIVMLHGGAWTANDRTTPWAVCEGLAACGMTVFSLDFRCGPQFQHPSAVSDIAAGIRWFKSQAEKFDIDPNDVGLIGSSSGGHLALFTGLIPDVPSHRTTKVCLDDGAFIESEISAEVMYIIALWPVSDPAGRYQYALENHREDLVQAQNGYFGSITAMQDAGIQNILQQKKFTHLPSVMLVQPGEDQNVPEKHTIDLLTALQSQKAEVSYRYMPGLPHAFAYNSSKDTDRLINYIWLFIQDALAIGITSVKD